MHMYAASFIHRFNLMVFIYLQTFCSPDCISAGTDRGSGAGGDGTEVSAERSLGRRAF